MLSITGGIIGGIGLFLLGMILMTDGLKALAGEALRGWLMRFTGKPLKAVATGAAVTAMVQSSSATTLATIGFVSAGLLGFSGAIGVIIGANIGTTSTGWIVALLGLKFSISTLAMPLIGLGALMKLLGRDRIALSGLALAGFGTIFVGIDVLQDAMAGLAASVDLARFATDGVSGRLLLVGVGVVMTVLMQSSSAAVATTLTALATGAIDTPQAAALVIGQNLGTTVTAAIAAIGGSTAAQRTAVVHVIFNVGTAIIAFALLPLFMMLVEGYAARSGGVEHALTIAAFHTAFNLLGAAIFLPQTALLGRIAKRLVPERRRSLARFLDGSLREVPALAVGAGERVMREVVRDSFATLASSMRGEQTGTAGTGARITALLDELKDFLSRLSAPQGAADQQRLLYLTQTLDHAQALRDDLQSRAQGAAIVTVPALQTLATELATVMEAVAAELAIGDHVTEATAQQLDQCRQRVNDVQHSARQAILEQAAGSQRSTERTLSQLAAQRWLERVATHALRTVHYLRASHVSPNS